ncbi:MAG: hypothetical protein RL660_74 [Bacteroidota bacterium]|jgi:signal transduction histidine kinase
MRKRLLLIFFLVLPSLVFAQVRFSNTDSLVQKLKAGSSTEKAYACLAFVDHYIDKSRPDSSLYWLYKVLEVYKVEPNSLMDYFITSRQAEIYYYDGLDQLGAPEARKCLSIATKLNDSFLLADAYNFMGLFALIQDSVESSIAYFRQSLQYIKHPPHPANYISLTKPLHVYGNIAEAYSLVAKLDSSHYYNDMLYRYANSNNRKRALVLAIINEGYYYNKAKKADSAMLAFNRAQEACVQDKIRDLELLTYAGKAEAQAILQNRNACIEYLKKGLAFANVHDQIGSLHRSTFFKSAYDLFSRMGENNLQLLCMQQRWLLDSAKAKRNNVQVQRVISALRSKEGELLKMQIKTTQQSNQRLMYLLAIALLMATTFAAIYLYNRYRLRQQLKLDSVKTRISNDLHDDIGATLSSIKLYSELAQTQTDQQQVNTILGKVGTLSKDAMEQISDIAWAIRPSANQSSTLESRIKDYATDMLSTQGIEVKYDIDDSISLLMQSIDNKKHLLLIIKECINNIGKYSEATQVNIALQKDDSNILLSITDNGRGFDKQTQSEGNGLASLRTRAESLNGQISIDSSPSNGVAVKLRAPIASFSTDS